MNNGKAAKAVISVPVKVQRSVLKLREKARIKRLEQMGTKYFEGHRDVPPIISCRVPQLNHYRGQVYSPYKKMPMATEHWQNRGTIGDFFSVVPFHGNYATKWNQFQFQKEKDSQEPDISQMKRLKTPKFGNYPLDDAIVEALERLGFKQPTNIQNEAIPRLIEGESAIVAAETGNGKTLAFLLPTIQRILDFKKDYPSVKDRRLNSPLALIITPGRELAEQIFDVAQSICSQVGIEARLELGGAIKQKILYGERKETDLLVGSLGGLQKMFGSNMFHREFTSIIVLDEADTLVDDTFSRQLVGFLSFISSSASKEIATGTQFIFSSATFPSNIKNALLELMEADQLPVIRTHYLHRILSHVHQKFIRAPKVGRVSYLLDIIEKDVQKSRSVLIFSNKTSTSKYLSHFLNNQGINCKHFSADINWRERSEILDDFLAGKFKFLSCTDLVSRGIDTSSVHHVVNYDFPWNISDYLHRAGRVGRVGSTQSQGHVTSLVCGRRSIEIVQSLETAVRTNSEVQDVESNIKWILNQRYGTDNKNETVSVD